MKQIYIERNKLQTKIRILFESLESIITENAFIGANLDAYKKK
jgi:hypothetical protein